jgi:hypothetical protein
MSHQDQWQQQASCTSTQGRYYSPSIEVDDSSTFVKLLYEGSSQPFSPYPYAPETAIPPPPPGIDARRVSQPKRNTGYQIALAVLIVLVVALGSLEVIQVVAHTPLTTYPFGIAGSNPAGPISAQYASASHKTSPGPIVTPGTIKEHMLLMCGSCDDPILATIISITIDTTNLRVIISVTLQNISGAQQIDYFAEFSLQDPFGNTCKGTGALNTDFILGAGQRGNKSEIFSFLPHPGISYVLIARLGISGITYDPLQLTF